MANIPTRLNNPGDIMDGPFAQAQPGYVGAEKTVSGTFAKFDTVANGVAAQIKLLGNYVNNGYDTISKIITKWAPPSQNDTAGYIAKVAKDIGIDPNAKLTDSQLAAVAQSMGKHEGYQGDLSSIYNWYANGGIPNTIGNAASSIASSVVGATVPTGIANIFNGNYLGRLVAIVIGVVLIGLAIAAFVLTTDTAREIVKVVK